MRIQNALPADLAEEMRKRLERAKYVGRRQSRLMGRSFGEGLPEASESYSACFGRSGEVDLGGVEKEVRRLLDLSGVVDLRPHRLCAGDHFRCHTDEGVGEFGFTITLSRGWKWDWGGLLMVKDGETPTPYLPAFNELVVINERLPHWVTEVSRWALEPRYTLVGFVRCG